MEIGIDLTYIPRFENYDRLAKKIFSAREYAYYLTASNKQEFVASRFCLKEAFIKCIKSGILNINLQEIEVVKEETGAIHIEYKGKTFKASLSHEKEYCTGVVIYD